MKFGILLAVLTLVFNILLVTRIGLPGVMIGTSCALIISTLYYMKLFHAYLGSPATEFFRLLSKPAFASLAAAAATFIFNHFIIKTMSSESRVVDVVAIMSGGLLFGLVYWRILAPLKYLTGYERSFIVSKAPFLEIFFKK
jgi:peptidoglycan biosynthesis protein MviN/MurJ (putative lipid II flippase)